MSEREIDISGLKFDQTLFTNGFEAKDGPNSCTSLCCRHGVYLDPSERDRIMAHADLIEKRLDETQTMDRGKWFDNTEEEDSDFPSGKCVSTQTHNDKCVFLRKDGKCSVQLTEREEGMARFSLKPFYCILFPIVKVDGVFMYDDFCSGESACCTASGKGEKKMIESCSIEFEHALGPVKYKEILEYFKNNFPRDDDSPGASGNARMEGPGNEGGEHLGS